ncbi:hypothetical protein AK812_SmicGene711 [Symbiodinium microadriaticum]|uniref:Uncharacterized protein n=1 Tax=Symbiodinium microadriaticum TaxID=2951 RepID=A0A1Q9F657_SYMMI|nr:hypothetical protein AK812_SmicGene711 [Symbiodinium microadriaticum]
MGKQALGEIAFATGAQAISEFDRVPYGCSKVSVDVPHNKITGPVAELARVLYFTRREAEEMMHAPKLDPKVRHYATDTANYAHDLEFFARQLGLALKMPTGVDPPYLPLDMMSMPDPSLLALLPTHLGPSGHQAPLLRQMTWGRREAR